MGLGHDVGDARVADLSFGPHEPLSHRRCGHEEGAGNFVRLQAAERAQRQGDLCFEREGWMAARENQSEAVVRDFTGVKTRLVREFGHSGCRVGGEDVRQPCPTPGCTGTVRRIVQGARSTFFCPVCQK